MAQHLAHAILAVALVLEWLLLPHAALPIAWPLTLLLFAVCIGFLVVWPRAQVFVETVYRARNAGPRIAFTFDDGPDPTWTPKVLDLLAQHGAKGTFFVVAQRAQTHPELIARIAREGHEIGCHTSSHAHAFHFWTAKRMARDLAQAQRILTELLGAPPRMFRPPQGIRVPQLRSALDRLSPQPRCVTWTARGFDSRPTTAARIEANLMPAVAAGSILTLHDGTGFGGGNDRTPTLAALDRLLVLATQRGLTCVALTPLLGEPA